MSGLTHRPAIFASLLAGLFCSVVTDLRAANPLPPSPAPYYILDEAKWLSPGAFKALDEKLKGFERGTSSQFIVAIFPKIPDGEEIVDFSQRLFELWKPGLKGKDNGAIFLIFAADRKMRIHTGFGMEGALPDARCKQIIQDVVAPQLRSGNKEVGINAGIDAMIAAAKGEYSGTGKTQGSHSRGTDVPPFVFFLLFFGIINLVRYLSWRLHGRYQPGASETWLSSGSASGGWSSGGSGGGSDSGGFSGGGGDSGGGGASGGW